MLARSVFVFLVLAVVLVNAHLCSLYPVQRGSIEKLSAVGTADCFLTTGPCGGRNAESPKSIMTAGSNTTIVFMKNEDHWYSTNPGNFTLTIFDSKNSKSVKLGSMPDTQTPSLTVFSLDVNVPHLETPLGYLQIVYYTNNPAVNNAVFYQCADVFFA